MMSRVHAAPFFATRGHGSGGAGHLSAARRRMLLWVPRGAARGWERAHAAERRPPRGVDVY